MPTKNIMRVLALAGFIVLCMTLVLLSGAAEPKEEPPAIGLVMLGSKDDPGWFKNSYIGMRDTCKSTGSMLYTAEFIDPNDDDMVMNAISDLHKKGAKAIFFNAHGYGRLVDRFRAEYPDTTFFILDTGNDGANVKSYALRLYQIRYLEGMAAGLKTKSGHIGYVSAARISDTINGINAFMLGVRRTNPSADVIVSFEELDIAKHPDLERSNEAAKNAAIDLIVKKGVDVLASNRENDIIIDVAREYGVYAVASYPDHEESDLIIAESNYGWNGIYSALIKEYERAFGRDPFYLYDMERGSMDFKMPSSQVTDKERAIVMQAAEELRNGFEPFSGEIKDTDGNIRCKKGEYISDRKLRQSIDWYVEGVKIYAP